MSDADEVVRVAAGSVVQIELYQQALKDAGVTSGRVVGTDLAGSFGSALTGSVELWVAQADAAKAAAAIERLEADRAGNAQ